MRTARRIMALVAGVLMVHGSAHACSAGKADPLTGVITQKEKALFNMAERKRYATYAGVKRVGDARSFWADAIMPGQLPWQFPVGSIVDITFGNGEHLSLPLGAKVVGAANASAGGVWTIFTIDVTIPEEKWALFTSQDVMGFTLTAGDQVLRNVFGAPGRFQKMAACLP